MSLTPTQQASHLCHYVAHVALSAPPECRIMYPFLELDPEALNEVFRDRGVAPPSGLSSVWSPCACSCVMRALVCVLCVPSRRVASALRERVTCVMGAYIAYALHKPVSAIGISDISSDYEFTPLALLLLHKVLL